MLNKIKIGFNNNLDYIPFVLALGALLGVGCGAAFFGAVVLLVLFSFLNRKINFIFGQTLPLAVFLAGAACCIQNSTEKLYALLFLTGVFTVVFSFFGKSYLPKKYLMTTFSFSAAVYGVFYSLALIFNQASQGRRATIFAPYFNLNYVDEASIVCALVVIAAYYYLSKAKQKGILPSLFAVLCGAFANWIFALNVECVGSFNLLGNGMKYGDFGKLPLTIFLGLLGASILTIQIISVLKASKCKVKTDKALVLSGVVNFVSSVAGCAGGAIIKPDKEKNFCQSLLELIILLCLTLFFNKTLAYIPVSALGAILFVKCYEVIKTCVWRFSLLGYSVKVVSAVCFCVLCASIIWGTVLIAMLTLIIRICENGKKN